MLIQADARHLPIRDDCVQTCITSPPYFGLRKYPDARQIGLEQTPYDFVASLVDVFREVRRVLKDDGTVWLNLGDSYSASGKGGNPSGSPFRMQLSNTGSLIDGQRKPRDGFLPKNLLGIPWRVAFALQDDGWYLRSDIIWSKPNPMPESVTDRPTKSHEYLFLLTKSAKYYYDQAAIYEPYAEITLREVEKDYDGFGLKDYEVAGVQNPSDTKRRIIDSIRERTGESKNIQGSMSARGVTRTTEGLNLKTAAEKRRSAHMVGTSRNDGERWRLVDGGVAPRGGRKHTLEGEDLEQGAGRRLSRERESQPMIGRNKRTVWTIATQAVTDSHYATFPQALVEPCVLAGSRPGDLVLDPFIGSGTVGLVAQRLFRRWVGCDLSYQDISVKRTAQKCLPLY